MQNNGRTLADTRRLFQLEMANTAARRHGSRPGNDVWFDPLAIISCKRPLGSTQQA